MENQGIDLHPCTSRAHVLHCCLGTDLMPCWADPVYTCLRPWASTNALMEAPCLNQLVLTKCKRL